MRWSEGKCPGAVRIHAAAAIMFLLPGACCGGARMKCSAARVSRPGAVHVEFLFSNLCSEEVLAKQVEVACEEALFSYGGNEAVAYGREVFLGEAYLKPGSHDLGAAVILDAAGKRSELRLGPARIDIPDRPIIVEVVLRSSGEGCLLSSNFSKVEAGPERCREPESEEESPPCK